MPAASCRIMPARSIRRCETISASFGFSLRIGRKNRDNRMGTLKESVRHGRWAVKPDRLRKHKGGTRESRQSSGFPGVLHWHIDRAIKAQTRHKTRTIEKALTGLLARRHVKL